MHYALFSMQCLPLVNLWWKPPQPWPCQTRPTSWVKHTGKRQRLKMDTKQKYQLSIYARKEYGASSPWIIQLWSFCRCLFSCPFPPHNLCILQLSSCICVWYSSRLWQTFQAPFGSLVDNRRSRRLGAGKLGNMTKCKVLEGQQVQMERYELRSLLYDMYTCLCIVWRRPALRWTTQVRGTYVVRKHRGANVCGT